MTGSAGGPAGGSAARPAAGWPFHPGERAAQAQVGAAPAGGGIRAAMPEQHRAFYAQLPWLLVGAVTPDGPVATVWTGAPGFVTSPAPTRLHVATALAPDDPATPALAVGAPCGLLGLEPSTRRRNRANGHVAGLGPAGIEVEVAQSFGNCPKYIHPRALAPAAIAPRPAPERATGLDAEAAAAIAAADTFFVASAAHLDAPTGGVDVAHRAGPPGFVRVDGDTLAIPDYAGNRYFNTLGNLLVAPRAGLLFLDLARGDALHLQGAAAIDWAGGDGAERWWYVRVDRMIRRRGALALRAAPAAG